MVLNIKLRKLPFLSVWDFQEVNKTSSKWRLTGGYTVKNKEREGASGGERFRQSQPAQQGAAEGDACRRSGLEAEPQGSGVVTAAMLIGLGTHQE